MNQNETEELEFCYITVFSLCFNSTSSSVKNLECGYNSVLRRLLCIRMPYSASEMFVIHGIPSFYELLHKYTYIHSERN